MTQQQSDFWKLQQTDKPLRDYLKSHSKLRNLLKKLPSKLAQDVVNSNQLYSKEEIDAMTNFIGAEKLPPNFKLAKYLKEIEYDEY